ncbi:4-hydroxy-tetrahydrodipicolinate synthase [Scopulibacillus darangshiensis]|uniref:4-hydroxy-tetrahydrodipicolinate synthase n=1 Tax=Scopulibacillus darangshiensis TaxID=442528 RepID=A0A4R2NQ21_9BACL|nr:dihydrodipicolinate synthase family protein [Scopulibacillus darangshiensis]TCP23454.1 4-hydroxy-tetrahydrodipicolinate synthase [Scopulibacillus darangshiensis]
MAKFDGVYVALVTPMTETFDVDYKRLHDISRWLISEGVNGLIPGGSLGEYAALSNRERAKVVETVISASQNNVPVVVGTGAPSTNDVLSWAEHAKEKGAEGLMALPPINYNPLENEVIAHYQALNTVGLPIIAYNNPRDYATDLTPELLAKIAAFDHVVGVKEFSGDVRRVHDILEKTDLEVMIGVDDLAMEGSLAGATGWISGVPNALPNEGVKLFQLAREGRIEEALPLYRKLLPLFHYDAEPQLVQAIKYMMSLAGQDAGPTRPPRLPLTDEAYGRIKDAYLHAKQPALN